MPIRRPLKELYVGGMFTEYRIIWKNALQRHREGVNEEVEETIKVQEDRIKK